MVRTSWRSTFAGPGLGCALHHGSDRRKVRQQTTNNKEGEIGNSCLRGQLFLDDWLPKSGAGEPMRLGTSMEEEAGPILP